MNRQEEYAALLSQLEATPPSLEGTVPRARARARRGRTLRLFGVPAASLGGLAAAFVLLVNLSLPFALACVNVPVLKDLMAAVAFSPSLRQMVENGFIQPIEQTQRSGDAVMTIHYLVYDGTQVNLLYTASYQGDSDVQIYPDYQDLNGEKLHSLATSAGMGAKEGELGVLRVEFYDEQVPAGLHLTAKMVLPTRQEGPPPEADPWHRPAEEEREPVAELTFDLPFDPKFTAARKTYTPHTQVDLDGRLLTVERVTVYPTGTRVEVTEFPTNDAKLDWLELSLVDSRGKVTGRRRQGTLSTGGAEEDLHVFWLESNYFDRTPQGLALQISQARWLEKGREWVTLDLTDPTSADLPLGVKLLEAERRGSDVKLTFSTIEPGGLSPVGGTYRTPAGAEDTVSVIGYQYDDDREAKVTYTYLYAYPWDQVDFRLNYNTVTTWEDPISVPLD